MSDEADDVEIAVEAAQIRLGYVVGAVGVVIDAGRHAALEGRRVLVGIHDACGECDACRRGGAPVCPNGRLRELAAGATRIRAAARWLVALDDGGLSPDRSAAEWRRGVVDGGGLSPDGSAAEWRRGVVDDGLEVLGPAAAAIPYDVALAYTMYARTGVAPREPVVVCGDDAVARFLVEVLIAKGIAPVVLADPSAAAWCAWLAARGANVALVDPEDAEVDVRIAVTAAIASDPTIAKSAQRPWRVIATGDVTRAAALANPRATLTLRAGVPDPELGGALAAALSREVTAQGVAGPHPDLVLEAAALVAKGELDLAAGVAIRRADELPTLDRSRADVVVS